MMSPSSLDISVPLSTTTSGVKKEAGVTAFKFFLPVTLVGCFILVSLAVYMVVSIALDDKLALASEVELLRAAKAEAERAASLRWSTATLNPQTMEPPKEPTLLLKIQEHGTIRIKLRADLSVESVQHIQQLAADAGKQCEKCQFYRSEKDLLLQGIMKPTDTEPSLVERPPKGPCPAQFVGTQQSCPTHDKSCGCHGPTMTKGMVGWAGGGTGPDFFINVYKEPVQWWGQQHTVWGIIDDEKSLALVENKLLSDLPTRKQGTMTMLQQRLNFQMEMETQ